MRTYFHYHLNCVKQLLRYHWWFYPPCSW